MRLRKKTLIGLAMLVAISTVLATQYGVIQVSWDYEITTSDNYVHWLSRDTSPTDTSKPLIYSSDNKTYSISLGKWAQATNKTYTAAFAIVNEEAYSITLDKVVVTGTGKDYMYIYVHEHAQKTCNEAFTADSSKQEASSDYKTMWDGSSGSTTHYWVLVAGDQSTNTYSDGTTTLDATWDSTYYGWKFDATDDTGNTKEAVNGTADYVWVEVGLIIPSSATAASLSGTIYFEFEATSEIS
ncbi:MAG: hypothetical protein E3J35_01845 [Methanomassiliicoccales archaeon]|nr:MAG: hypothetical protein E3J35_01845 [Methanomassiliicoccales archaeon]